MEKTMTEKKISGYLKLYLGCKVQTDLGVGTLEIVSTGDMGCAGAYSVLNEADSELYHETDLDWIKPILRPLSSMTFEESEHLKWVHPLKEYDVKSFLNNLEAHEIPYLLKQGFDLFGLIQSGLAVEGGKDY